MKQTYIAPKAEKAVPFSEDILLDSNEGDWAPLGLRGLDLLGEEEI